VARYHRNHWHGISEISNLANNLVFIQISTDISSALKIFETINERGIGLNPMDLLKNLLFTQVNTSDFTKLKNEWKKITAPLEKRKEKPLRFLRYFLMANYKIENDRSDAIVREDEIYDWFIEKENAALCDYKAKPFEFVRKIIKNVESFVAFSNGKGNDGNDNVNMDNLKLLCGAAFSLHYVLLLSASNLPKPLFDQFVKQLESFLFYYIFTKGIELTDSLKRYTLNSMQQYRTRYLLAKLTQYVDMAYKGLKSPGSLSEYTVLEIEHILPNKPEAVLRADFTKKNPDKEYDVYKTMFGNLTMLEKPINIVAGNNFFQLKCGEYKKCKYYLTSSIAEIVPVGKNSSITRINTKLKSFSDWDVSAIESRQAMLIKLASEI